MKHLQADLLTYKHKTTPPKLESQHIPLIGSITLYIVERNKVVTQKISLNDIYKMTFSDFNKEITRLQNRNNDTYWCEYYQLHMCSYTTLNRLEAYTILFKQDKKQIRNFPAIYNEVINTYPELFL